MKKFPVVFRIYAALNLLIFIALCFMSVVMTAEAPRFGAGMLALQWSLVVWLLITTIAWFFASKHSYHFLYTLGAMLLIVGTAWLYVGWFHVKTSLPDDKIIMSILAGCALFYLIFLLAAMFYKPVMEWSEKRFNIKHAAYAVSVLVLFTGVFFCIDTFYRKSSDLGISYTYWGTDASLDDQPAVIKGDGWVRFDLDAVAMVNGLSMTIADTAKAQQLQYARLHYGEEADKFDAKSAPNIIIKFKRSGNQLISEFQPLKARVLQLFPMSDAKTQASESMAYQVAALAPVWMHGLFDQENPEVFYDENGYVQTTGDYEAQPDVSNGRTYTASSMSELYTLFLRSTDFPNSDYSFDKSLGSITQDDEEFTYAYGMYKLGMPNLWYTFGDAAKLYQGFSQYDYERYISELVGKSFYASKAKGYQFVGNGTPFNNINPEIISWAEQNLIPDPSMELFGYTAQDYYDNIFMRYARMMVLAHIYLEKVGIDAEANLYKSAAEREDFYGALYLQDRYRLAILDEYKAEDGWSESYEFIGFWLRRHIDATDAKCWNALSNTMNKYDKAWFETADVNVQN